MVDRPNWLPANFDSPEALVTSYKEAQRMLTKCFQDSADVEKLIPQGFRRTSLTDSVSALIEALTAALVKVSALVDENKVLANRVRDLEQVHNDAARLAVLANNQGVR